MATILESFVTEFTVDPAPFEKGSAAVRDATAKTREEVSAGTKDFDTYGKRASQFFGKLRNEAVGLFLAFQGASSIKGYISDILTGDAATGRLAANIGMATQELSAWQLAIKTVGGTADDANSALTSIADAFNSYMLLGTTGHDADFKGLGVTYKDLQDPAEALLKMAEAGERMDRTEFYARLKRIGIPDSVINQLVKGREATERLIEEKKKDGAATDANAKAAEEFQVKLAELEAKITGLVRPALYAMVTGLLDVLDGVDGNNIAVPILVGAVASLALGVLAVAGPFIAWAAAIAGVTAALNGLISTSPKLRSFLDGIEAPIKEMLGPKWEWLFERPGNLEGNSGSAGESAYKGGAGGGGGKSGGGSGNEAYIRDYLRASGLTDEQTKGVMAGMFAESGMNPNAVNPTSGAYGIGQWLGPRKRALMKKYGPNPTLRQQLAFMVEELKGGDWGGKSVMQSKTAEDTLSNYVGGPGWGFMRPDPAGRAGDMRRGYGYLGRGPSRPAGSGLRPSPGAGASSTHIGTIVVNTAATDANGIARDLPGALRRRGVTAQANRGME